MKTIGSDLFTGLAMTDPSKDQVVHVIDVDDTLTCKPLNFNNVGMSKELFFDASRDFPANNAMVELTQMLHSFGDAIAIATARPSSRLPETFEWLQRHSIPFDLLLLSTEGDTSSVVKQAMIQYLQGKYRMVGTLFDDSPANIRGAALQGVDAIQLNTNSEYWDKHPELTFAYGL